MAFPAPPGYTVATPVGAGSVFDVALVEGAGVVHVCKRIRPGLEADLAAQAAFQREVGILGAAHHPALPALVEHGTDLHGPFVVEERIDGADLRTLARRWEDTPITPTFARRVAVEAFRALAEIHELADAAGPLSIVHADLAPDHVILRPSGTVGLIDFSASRARIVETPELTFDRGTVPYAAPELLRGEARPSTAGDVYALAATLLFSLTSEIAPTAHPAFALVRAAEAGIPDHLFSHPRIPPELATVLRNALRGDPPRRLSSARNVLEAL